MSFALQMYIVGISFSNLERWVHQSGEGRGGKKKEKAHWTLISEALGRSSKHIDKINVEKKPHKPLALSPAPTSSYLLNLCCIFVKLQYPYLLFLIFFFSPLFSFLMSPSTIGKSYPAVRYRITNDHLKVILCFLFQAALGIMQMVEDTLIEHAHTKPLLPSQLVRYREVQLPDSKWNDLFKIF